MESPMTTAVLLRGGTYVPECAVGDAAWAISASLRSVASAAIAGNIAESSDVSTVSVSAVYPFFE
jgi:hypothetical protein